jgi:hypothetical protein
MFKLMAISEEGLQAYGKAAQGSPRERHPGFSSANHGVSLIN